MSRLLTGLSGFLNEERRDHEAKLVPLGKGQSPHTLMITCSDSRIDPNFFTRAELGDIFVLRNPGNIIPRYGGANGGEDFAIELAVLDFKVETIVVCGHSHCGAMSALCEKGEIFNRKATQAWLKHTEPTVKRVKTRNEQANANAYIEENVLVQVENLKTHPAVSEGVRQRNLAIFAWVYDVASGNVLVYSTKRKAFVSATDVNLEARPVLSELCM